MHAIFAESDEGNLPALWADPGTTFEQEVADLNAAYHDHGIQFVLEGFDVAAACERQRTFLWQVSGPRFDEGYFLCDGARRYENFLRLMRSGEFLVPTYQIDLFWHTHILASASTYAADTRRLCGFELPHDDSVNDRAEGSKLNRQYEVTQKLWAENYGERYAVPGGMYHGEPPEAYFEPT